ncbi:TIGR03745 family integrating conjugative element membrane protein [Rhodanobacter lindaniclasticus]
MNTPKTSHRIPSRIAAPLLPLALAGLPLSAFAQGLPTMEDPSRGQGSGILQTLQNYGYDIVLLIALLVVASDVRRCLLSRLHPLLGDPHRPRHLGPAA